MNSQKMSAYLEVLLVFIDSSENDFSLVEMIIIAGFLNKIGFHSTKLLILLLHALFSLKFSPHLVLHASPMSSLKPSEGG